MNPTRTTALLTPFTRNPKPEIAWQAKALLTVEETRAEVEGKQHAELRSIAEESSALHFLAAEQVFTVALLYISSCALQCIFRCCIVRWTPL